MFALARCKCHKVRNCVLPVHHCASKVLINGTQQILNKSFFFKFYFNKLPERLFIDYSGVLIALFFQVYSKWHCHSLDSISIHIRSSDSIPQIIKALLSFSIFYSLCFNSYCLYISVFLGHWLFVCVYIICYKSHLMNF